MFKQILKEYLKHDSKSIKEDIYISILKDLQYSCAEEGVYFSLENITLNFSTYSLYVNTKDIEFSWKSIIKDLPEKFGKLRFEKEYVAKNESVVLSDDESVKDIVRSINKCMLYFKFAFYACFDTYYDIDYDKKVPEKHTKNIMDIREKEREIKNTNKLKELDEKRWEKMRERGEL